MSDPIVGLVFDVDGIPVPQGSKRVANGRLIDANTAKLKPWRATVTAACADAMRAAGITGPVDGPVRVKVVFRLPRPKHHYRTGKHAGQLKDGAPYWAATRPDLDKLLRAVLDALTDAGLWHDDAQVAVLHATKEHGTPVAGIQVEWDPGKEK